jgi:hypothetical protein
VLSICQLHESAHFFDAEEGWGRGKPPGLSSKGIGTKKFTRNRKFFHVATAKKDSAGFRQSAQGSVRNPCIQGLLAWMCTYSARDVPMKCAYKSFLCGVFYFLILEFRKKMHPWITSRRWLNVNALEKGQDDDEDQK